MPAKTLPHAAACPCAACVRARALRHDRDVQIARLRLEQAGYRYGESVARGTNIDRGVAATSAKQALAHAAEALYRAEYDLENHGK